MSEEPQGIDPVQLKLKDNKMNMVRDATTAHYAKAKEHFCRLYFPDGAVMDFPHNLKKLQKLLAPSGLFARVHKSYLVKLSEVTGYVRYKARLGKELFIPLGRAGYAVVHAYMLSREG